MIHLVQFSTGVASAEVAWRVVAEHGPDRVICLTADTKVEDPDNWRFGREVIDRIGCRWEIIADGRTPMQAGRDRKCVPSDRMDVCSQLLKRKILNDWRNSNCDPDDTVTYLGFDWTEPHRIANATRMHAPWMTEFPLTRPPYLWKLQMMDLMRDRGIEPPALYAEGFEHANCGGGCVRKGQREWNLLLQVRPHTYAYWEAEEEQTRAELGKNVAILKEKKGGKTRPLPLREFRERLERDPTLFDPKDTGSCHCIG